jgi:hypothetical protein
MNSIQIRGYSQLEILVREAVANPEKRGQPFNGSERPELAILLQDAVPIESVDGCRSYRLCWKSSTELVHGIYRASSQPMRVRRQSFISELLRDPTAYPYTRATALCREDRRRTAGQGSHSSLRRSAYWRCGAGAWLSRHDRESTTLPANPRTSDSRARSLTASRIPRPSVPIRRRTGARPDGRSRGRPPSAIAARGGASFRLG